MDGTLVQTEHVKARAHAAVAARNGTRDPGRELYGQLIGQPSKVVAARFMEAAGCQLTFEEYRNQYLAECARIRHEGGIELAPGATSVLDAAYQRGPLGLVTSSSRQVMIRTLVYLGLQRYFRTKVSSSDVQYTKPDPEPYLKALNDLHTLNEPWCVVEDTPPGVAAALAAGCPCVLAVRHEYNTDVDLSSAHRVFDNLFSLADLIRVHDAPLV